MNGALKARTAGLAAVVRNYAFGIALRIAIFGVLWWVLTEGAASMLQYGFVMVPVSAAVSLVLLPPRKGKGSLQIRLGAAVALLSWFLWQSFRGGADVAVRALRRPVDLDPDMITHHTALPEGIPQFALTAITSLMPGTLSVDLDADQLQVHVLDRSARPAEQVAALERRISAVLG